MNSYKADPISRNNIKNFVHKIKEITGFENDLYFPVVHFLEHVLPVLVPDFCLEIVPKNMMGSKHGETFPSKNLIRIREDIYLRACNGEGRDRLTIAHEIGHLFLHDNDSIALCRLEPGESIKPYEDPEWQADCFGGELLASSYLIKNLSVETIMNSCGVTRNAATVQKRNT